MNKNKFLSVFLIIVLFASVASAGFFDDFFSGNIITGRQVDEGNVDAGGETAPAPEPQQSSEPMHQEPVMHDEPKDDFQQDDHYVDDHRDDNYVDDHRDDNYVDDHRDDHYVDDHRDDNYVDDHREDDQRRWEQESERTRTDEWREDERWKPEDERREYDWKRKEDEWQRHDEEKDKQWEEERRQWEEDSEKSRLKFEDEMRELDEQKRQEMKDKKPDMPPGCFGKEDKYGNFRIICDENKETKKKFKKENCPSNYEVSEKAKQCGKDGGDPKILPGDRGCMFVDCRFGRKGPKENEKERAFFEQRETECPPPEELDDVKRKCEETGGKTIIKNERGCNFVDCVHEEFDEGRGFGACAEDDNSFRREIKTRCGENGGTPIKGFDPQGCPITLCEKPHTIQKQGARCSPPPKNPETENCEPSGGKLIIKYNTEGCTEFIKCEGGTQGKREFCNKQGPPEKAYKKCEYEGGKLIVNFDDKGCVGFVDCVRRGDENKIEYEDVRENIDVGTLMDIALKLEQLNVEFDKLSAKAEDLAKYHESQGDDANAEKFQRVAGMFEGAKGKVNELMLDIRGRIGKISKEDLISIKHDIKYIKEVILNDILYVMFTPAEELGEIEMPEFDLEFDELRDEYGDEYYPDDGRIFDEHLRICKAYDFHPPEDPKTTVQIVGVENKKCKIYAFADTPMGKMDMTCFYPNYAFGMMGPEDLMPYCEGKMKEMFEMHGGPGGPGGPRGGPEPRNEAERCMMECVDKPCRPMYDPDPDCQRCEAKCFGRPDEGPEPRHFGGGAGPDPYGPMFTRKCCQGLPQACIVDINDKCPKGTSKVLDGECPEGSGSGNCVMGKGELIYCKDPSKSKGPGSCRSEKEGDSGVYYPGPQPMPISKEEQCIMECVGDTFCMPGDGYENPKCKECEEKCTKHYEGPCFTDADWKREKAECQRKYGPNAGDEPIYDESQGYKCVVDIKCIDFRQPEPDTSKLDPDCVRVGALSREACDRHLSDVEAVGPGCDDCAADCPGSSRTDCINNRCECYYEDEVSECADGCHQECGDQNTDCVNDNCVCLGYPDMPHDHIDEPDIGDDSDGGEGEGESEGESEGEGEAPQPVEGEAEGEGESEGEGETNQGGEQQ